MFVQAKSMSLTAFTINVEVSILRGETVGFPDLTGYK